MKKYITKRSGSNKHSVNGKVSGSDEDDGVSFHASASFAHSSSSEYSGLHELFQKKRGEIVMATTECSKIYSEAKDYKGHKTQGRGK